MSIREILERLPCYPAMKDWRKAVLFLVLSLIGLLISDTSGNVLKHLFERPRPCSGLEEVRMLVTCGHSFSFPSNHAVNAFAVAAICSHFYRKSALLFYLIAAAVAFHGSMSEFIIPQTCLSGQYGGFYVPICFSVFIRIILKNGPLFFQGECRRTDSI